LAAALPPAVVLRLEQADAPPAPKIRAPRQPGGAGTVRRGEVPSYVTALDAASMLAALGRGHVRAFGVEPTNARLAGAFALASFETDHGAALYNFNFGNVEAASADVPHTRWPRGSGDARLLRAYDTAESGAADLWNVLRRRHGAALRAFDKADYPAAAAALARQGYFEATASRYIRALPRLAAVALATQIPQHRAACRRLGTDWTAQAKAPTVRAVDPSSHEVPLP